MVSFIGEFQLKLLCLYLLFFLALSQLRHIWYSLFSLSAVPSSSSLAHWPLGISYLILVHQWA